MKYIHMCTCDVYLCFLTRFGLGSFMFTIFRGIYWYGKLGRKSVINAAYVLSAVIVTSLDHTTPELYLNRNYVLDKAYNLLTEVVDMSSYVCYVNSPYW